MFVRRGRRGPDPYLHWRTRLLALGALLALAGIGFERPWLVNVAIGVLVLSFGLGVAGRGRGAEPEEESEETDTEV